MSSSAEGKKWSKKKKIAVIVISVLMALIVLVVSAGVYALNWYCKTAEYEVLQTSRNVTLIAHRGMRSVAPENTAPAFEEAGKNGYWGAECDIYRTKDGVWVVSHDSHTYRMMDKSAFVEKSTYEELMAQRVANGVNFENYPDLSFCSLEDYLKICKDYGMVAVIELKGKNNTEHYNEIIDLVKQYDIEAVYISFHFENLEKIRALTDAPVYFLTQEISDEDIELALSLDNCGIDFNGNKEANFEKGMIKKCIEKGLEVGAWTIDDISTLDRLVAEGVTLITTDNIINSKTAEYEILQTGQNVTLIAHRGMRSVAPENTAPAFEEAGKHDYWGAECDVYRTKDGVWIISHDSDTDEMMDGSAFIEESTYEELMEQRVDNGVNYENYPDLSFCSLEDYLKICKEYGMVAVIELKGKNNTEYYNEIIDLVKQYGTEAVYISFHFENLEKIRVLTAAPVYFLTQEISDEDIELALSLDNCGIDFNGNKEANFEKGMIKKCIEKGLEVGAWTIDDINTLDRLVAEGVTLITTDNITK